MKIIGKVYSSRAFHWDAELKLFSGTITGTPAVLRTLWDEEMEIGFAIKSARTGSVVPFVLKGMDKDEATDRPIRWKFEAYNPHGIPGLEGLRAIIENE